jgi:hypothetical protein
VIPNAYLAFPSFPVTISTQYFQTPNICSSRSVKTMASRLSNRRDPEEKGTITKDNTVDNSTSSSVRNSAVPGAALPLPASWKDAASRALGQQEPVVKRKKRWHGEDDKNSHPSHFEMNLVLKERIRHFTWTWFCMTMATGGIANVLYVISLLRRKLWGAA